MKSLFSIWTLIFFYLPCCYGQEPLYPYTAGTKYGFSTRGKKMVIPAVYREIKYNHNFYVADDSTGKSVVFNRQWQAIDSAYDIYLAGDRVLLVNPYRVTDPKKLAEWKPNRRYHEWEDLTPSKAWTIDSAGRRSPITDTVIAVSNEHLWLKFRNGNKQGIYDVLKNSFVVPMTPGNIRVVTRKFMVTQQANGCKAYTVDGIVYDVPKVACGASNIYNNGKYFETYLPENRKVLHDNTGKTVMRAEKYWTAILNNEKEIIGFYVYTNPKKFGDDGTELYDARGNFIRTVRHFEPAKANNLLISEFDSTNASVPKKYLFDITKNNRQLMDIDDPSGQNKRPFWEFVKTKHQFITVYKGGVTAYFNGYTGERLFDFPDSFSELNFRKQMIGSVSEHHHADSPRYHFVRLKTDGPLTLYDPQLGIISKTYDSIQDSRFFLHRVYAVKKDGKWGLVNRSFKALTPIVYDWIDPLFTSLYNPANENYVHVRKGDKTFWIDTTGKVLFGGNDFSYVTGYAVNGHWLAIDYTDAAKIGSQYHRIDSVHLVDREGKKMNTWLNPPAGAHTLTVNGRILNYTTAYNTREPRIKLFDPRTNRIDSLPYNVKNIVTLQKAALLIVCENDSGQTAVFSALDLSPVIAFGNYRHQISAKEIVNSGMGREDGVEIKLLEEWGDEQNVYGQGVYRADQAHGGFYSKTGIKYWD